MSDTVDKIKERLSVLDVVQQYVKLTRAGKYYKGLSPFTKEKTPSFFVSPDRGLYHCFSTGKGGDMFTFLQEMEGVDFRGSLKMLAEKAGVPLETERPEERDERERLYRALQAATEFFVEQLKSKDDAREYLKNRGLLEETITGWSVGYAPKEWQSLHTFLTGKGFTEIELERAGLIKKQESSESRVPSQELTQNSELGTQNSSAPKVRTYDRFRGRIMFPIRDITGRVIAFSGRIFPEESDPPKTSQSDVRPTAATQQFRQAKYLNSPETPVFEKSRVFYGLDQAREGIRTLKAALLVEGQIDLLMAHQSGYRNAVATSGTAFTDAHAGIIKRYTPNLLLAYDGDSAGISAAGRAAGVALRLGLDVKVAKLPPGKDPADILKEDKELFRSSIKGALHVVDFYLAHLADAKYDQRTFRLEVTRTVLPYVAMIPQRVDQAHFVARVADVLGVPADAVSAELKKVQSPQADTSPGESRFRALNSELTRAEPFLSRADIIARIVLGLTLLFTEKGDERAVVAKKSLIEAFGDEKVREMLEPSDNTRAALFEADLFLERNQGGVEQEALMSLYEALKSECHHEKYRETLVLLRAAETAHDTEEIEALMKRLNELAPTLK